jgi:predicted Fe-Mo cluster-binding NifX family protein
MKIAISALGSSLDAKVDERFGRAAVLLIVDTETLDVEALDNSENQQALKGAGYGAVELICAQGAQAVLTGHLGPNAFGALEKAGILGYNATGFTVAEAIVRFKEGNLEKLGEGSSYAGM